MTARSLIGLSGVGANVRADRFDIDGESVLNFGERDWRRLRGEKIGFVLQDALVSLDPLRRISQQLSDAFGRRGLSPARMSAGTAMRCCARSASPTRKGACRNIRISCPVGCANAPSSPRRLPGSHRC
ncbi:hypothetical protein ACOJBM_00990 [Rhizobium beringeri]